MVDVTFKCHMYSAQQKILDIYSLWIGPTSSPVLYKLLLFLYYFVIDITAYNPFNKLVGITVTFSQVNKLKLTVIK